MMDHRRRQWVNIITALCFWRVAGVELLLSRVNNFVICRKKTIQAISTNVNTPVLSCKAKRQYLFNLQRSRFCFLSSGQISYV